jgi:hypothetical protein
VKIYYQSQQENERKRHGNCKLKLQFKHCMHPKLKCGEIIRRSSLALRAENHQSKEANKCAKLVLHI